MKRLLAALLIGAAVPAVPAAAQTTGQVTQAITGTRLDLSVTGEVTRVPDLAVITAGVVSRASTATAALQDNAQRMDRVITALKSAGLADRDVQTSSINLNPEYKYVENQAPQLVGYTASNQVTVKFRDIRNSGKILDALVREGANQINGPNMTVEHPEAALDEARANAIAAGRARAALYARSLGLRVVRVVSVSEGGSYYAPPAPPPPPAPLMAAAERSYTRIEPGEQKLQVTLSMVFELQ
ncbi:MAG: SIMPL domain-containing protein [Sphingomicrobium sp.]